MSTQSSSPEPRSGLWLSAGGTLVNWRWQYDEATEHGEYVPHPVTERASEFLGEKVTLEDGVTLADLFELLERDHVLLAVFRRDFAVELLAEVRAAKAAGPWVAPDEPPEERIEYLELYRIWERNAKTHVLEGVAHVSFHGVGPVLEADVLDHGHVIHRAGSRIQWGVSTASPASLLGLPLRYRTKVLICEGDLDSREWGRERDAVELAELTLFELLHAVLWELSFHGAGKDREAFLTELHASVEAVRNGTAKTTPVDLDSL